MMLAHLEDVGTGISQNDSGTYSFSDINKPLAIGLLIAVIITIAVVYFVLGRINRPGRPSD